MVAGGPGGRGVGSRGRGLWGTWVKFRNQEFAILTHVGWQRVSRGAWVKIVYQDATLVTHVDSSRGAWPRRLSRS